MTRHAALRLTLAFAATVLLTTAVSAIPRTFVSRAGGDANPCTEVAPCRTFAGAITRTDAKGEIVVLDSGEYGPVTITKAVRITAVGVYAGITTVESGVSVNVDSLAVVVLRGLTITGTASSSRGIDHGKSGTIHVEGCTISGFGAGIYSDATGSLFIKDTILRNNSHGIDATSEGVYTMTAMIDNCRLEKNSYGLFVKAFVAGGGVKVTVRDSIAANNFYGYYADGAGVQLSVFDSEAVYHQSSGFLATNGAKMNAHHCVSSNNNGNGFSASLGAVLSIKDCTAAKNSSGVSSSGTSSKASVEGCQLINNGNSGLFVSGGGAALISDTMVAGNNVGLRNNTSSPGTLKTFGNNRVQDNTTNKVGTTAAVAQM